MAASIYASKSGIASDPGSIRPGTVSAAVKQPAVAVAVHASQLGIASSSGSIRPGKVTAAVKQPAVAAAIYASQLESHRHRHNGTQEQSQQLFTSQQ